ncbi:excinuclease ABC subunit UvrC [Gammaproteobacteria bacterium]|nr:excinuclease ABC subunit UvrC [Gammaproteobacteria bacterium]
MTTPFLFDHQSFLKNLTRRPGVYRMLNANGKIIYVGKAKNLKNRVTSYFRASGLTAKTLAMVNKISEIEVTVTNTEVEALLLEQTLIQTHKPNYNIQMRDDKSYPFIRLTEHPEYPRLMFFRGKRQRTGQFFGPYPSAPATRETLQLLQKVFKVRQCQESYFKNRSRPCLQYQIDRCTAPCVGLISKAEYAKDVKKSVMFLNGKSDQLLRELRIEMDSAALNQEFEKAVVLRDQIERIRLIQSDQIVTNKGDDADVLGLSIQGIYVCVQVIFIRDGRIIGSKNFFPVSKLSAEPSEVMAACIAQYYLADENRKANIPAEIISSIDLSAFDALKEALSSFAGRKIRLSVKVRGHRLKWVRLAVTNAEESLLNFIGSKNNSHKRFADLQGVLGFSKFDRVECFDISHTSGEGPVASCVVFDKDGPIKSDYRRFNIEGVTGGDDYAAMSQALSRRFSRLKKGEGKEPDLLLVDGGKGQLTQARRILDDLELKQIGLLGIAKGISRRAGQETLFFIKNDGFDELVLPQDSGALHLLQNIRDEAHRFAIVSHRHRRAKARKISPFEQIAGLGPKRRRALLKHFGGRQGVQSASQQELTNVEGISMRLAAVIYSELHLD